MPSPASRLHSTVALGISTSALQQLQGGLQVCSRFDGQLLQQLQQLHEGAPSILLSGAAARVRTPLLHACGKEEQRGRDDWASEGQNCRSTQLGRRQHHQARLQLLVGQAPASHAVLNSCSVRS